MNKTLAKLETLTGSMIRQSLPGHAYTDPAVYKREQAEIFSRTWQYVCHVEKVRRPGDYMVCDVAGESVIVIRGRDNQLNTFFNVCPHRATRLLQGEGCKNRFSCPYHGWTFASDGSLVAAPNEQKVAGFDKRLYDLKPCGVEEMHGLVFVNLDVIAEPLCEQASGLGADIWEYAPQLPELTFVHRTEVCLKANWKVAVENYSECYHCLLTHPNFVTGVVDPDTYKIQVHGLWQKHLSVSRTGPAKTYDYEEDGSTHACEFGAWYLWPNFAFQSYPGGSVHVWKWTPADEGNTHVFVDWFSPSKDLKDWEREMINDHASTTFAEDIPLVESVQQGLTSRAYGQGPVMIDEEQSLLSEHGIAAIQDLWRNALGEPDTTS